MINPTLKAQIDAMPYQDQDDIYRYLWHQHVMEDVEAHSTDMGVTLTKDEIDLAAERYVYDGDYDCNFDYWSNIEGVINKVLAFRPKGD